MSNTQKFIPGQKLEGTYRPDFKVRVIAFEDEKYKLFIIGNDQQGSSFVWMRKAIVETFYQVMKEK